MFCLMFPWLWAVAAVIGIAYIGLVIIFIFLFWKTKKTNAIVSKSAKIFISVVVVYRNEALNMPNLIENLDKQDLDKANWELLLVNDFSEDEGLSIAAKYLSLSSIHYLLLSNDQFSAIISPKKRGITQAISVSRGSLIVCTDADCSLPSTWLSSIAAFYEQEDVHFISSPVRFEPVQNIFEALQAVEFASLIGSGLACIRLDAPTMCNGANIAYTKEAFLAVGGFSGFEQVVSGDDEFLMHKIARKYPVKFLKSEQAMVSTAPNPNWQSLFQQRKRWASKWQHYQNPLASLLAMFIFITNLLSVVLWVLWAFYPQFSAIGWFFISKFFVECVFLGSVLFFLGQFRLWACVLLLFFIYPFYVVFFALISRKKNYLWKNRKH